MTKATSVSMLDTNLTGRYALVQHADRVAVHLAWFDAGNKLVKVERKEETLSDVDGFALRNFMETVYRDLGAHQPITTAEFLRAS